VPADKKSIVRIFIIVAAALPVDFLIGFLVGGFLQFSSEAADPAEPNATPFSGPSMASPASVQPRA
jgi:hypothetical protein